MKHAIACLNTQIGILLHNASVFHGEGREEDRDRATDEADDLRMAVKALRDEDELSGIPISETPPVKNGSGIEPATLILELGKRYVRRDGKITGCLIGGFDRLFTFRDTTHEETYRQNGLSGFEDDEEWEADIVAEFTPLEPSPLKISGDPKPEVFASMEPDGEVRISKTSSEIAEIIKKMETFETGYRALGSGNPEAP